MEMLIGLLIAGLIWITILFGKRQKVTRPITDEWNRDRVIGHIRNIAIAHKLDPDFAQAIAEVESGYNPNAINPRDPSYGVMQLTMAVAKHYNPNIKDRITIMNPVENILAGVRFLADLRRKYPNAFLSDIAEMYNLGETKFRKGFRNPRYSDKVLEIMHKLKGGK